MNLELDEPKEEAPKYYTIRTGQSFYLWQTMNDGNHCMALDSFEVGLVRKADGEAGKAGWMIVVITTDAVEVMHGGVKETIDRRDLLLWHPNS